MVGVSRGPDAGASEESGWCAAGVFLGGPRSAHALSTRNRGAGQAAVLGGGTRARNGGAGGDGISGPTGFVGSRRGFFFAMAGRAKQIVEWDRTHRFCGRCGTETGSGPSELAKECPRCEMLFFPRLSPAAIVLVRRGEGVLLARSPGFPPGMYSVLAGFVEPGESIEETIEREIREEVGIEVGNVRYFGSQPWPFPHSLMIGFTADYAGGELRTDPTEIEDADWCPADDLPDLPPKVSIARAMIDRFVAQHGRNPETLETSG